MNDLVEYILSHRQKKPQNIILDHVGKIRSYFVSHLTDFGCLNYQELKNFSKNNNDNLILLCSVQCLAQDLIILKTMSITDFLATKSLADSVWTLREPIKQFFLVKDFPIYGAKEPFHSKKPRPLTSLKIARLRYIHDVLHVDKFISFEARNFKQEAEGWSLVSKSKAELIEIDDWSLPSTKALVNFALIVQDTCLNNAMLCCHCIGGRGRTGTCILFLLMCRYKIFDLIILLFELAERYNPTASNEIITIIQNHKISIKDLYKRFIKAYEILLPQIKPNSIFQKIESFPKIKSNSFFDDAELAKLKRKGLQSRK